MILSDQYLAGFFDGEGSVGIYRGGGTGRTLRAQITQAQSLAASSLLSAVQARCGGSISMLHKNLRRPALGYQVGGDGAATLLRVVQPHLVLKEDQVTLALLWFDRRPPRRRDPRTGRVMARETWDKELSERVAAVLASMKRDSLDGAALTALRHDLEQR